MIIPLASPFSGWRLWAGLGLLVAALGSVVWWSEHQREAGRLEEREVWQRKEAIEAAEAAIRRQYVATQHQEIIDGARLEVLRAEADRDAAVADGARLRDQFAARLQARCVAPAAGASAPADDPIGVFAEVFGRIEGAAERYAAEADANRIAGDACVRAYNALSPRSDMDGGRLDH